MAQKEYTEDEIQELESIFASLDVYQQQGMESYPCTIKIAPHPIDILTFDYMRELKNDDKRTEEDIMLEYKKCGDLYMRRQQLDLAIQSYTEGLEVTGSVVDEKADLYNNRSIARFILKNYRLALADAQKTLSYKPGDADVLWRAAQCSLELENFDGCKQFCEKILEIEANNKATQELLTKNEQAKIKKEEKDRRMHSKSPFQRLCHVLKERKVKFNDHQDITKELLKPKYRFLKNHPVRLEHNGLKWPIMFYYPEYKFPDVETTVNEHQSMINIIFAFLAKPLWFNAMQSYSNKTVNVYYLNREVVCFHKVDLQKTLREILQEESFAVSKGYLKFYVVVKNSRIEEQLLDWSRRNIMKYVALKKT